MHIHSCIATDSLHSRIFIRLYEQLMNMDRSIAALGSDVFCQWIPSYSLNVVIMFRDLSQYRSYTDESYSSVFILFYVPSRAHSPSFALMIRATKSVPPMTSESPDGDHAMSYISEEDARHIVLNLQCSFANSASPSSSIEAPNEEGGPSDWIHSSIMPSDQLSRANQRESSSLH